MRQAVGPDADLCFDAHARIWAPYLAYELAEVLKPGDRRVPKTDVRCVL